MILPEITVRNFRPFKVETFYFSERVTVIAGVNGRGKSAILDALAIALSHLLPQVTPAKAGQRIIRAKDIHFGQTGLRLDLQATMAGLPIDFMVDYSISENGTESRSVNRFPTALRQAITTAYGTGIAPIAVYYGTERAYYYPPSKLFKGMVQDQAAAYKQTLRQRQIDFRDFMSRYRTWFSSVQQREDASGKNQRTLDIIECVIRRFLPGFSHLRVEENPVRLLVNKQGAQLDLSQTSDGERSLLAILIDLCRRLVLANPSIDDPLQGSGVVLIDEIELHLHVRWQREIIEKLRTTFPNIQFILTTHSPFIVQTLRDGELRLLADDLDDDSLQDPGDYSKRGLEEVATKVMGIEDPNVVPRYTKMLDAAKAYYQLLETATPNDEQQLMQLRAKLDELVEPFPDEPEYRAFLEVQRVAAFKEGQPGERE